MNARFPIRAALPLFMLAGVAAAQTTLGTITGAAANCTGFPPGAPATGPRWPRARRPRKSGPCSIPWTPVARGPRWGTSEKPTA